MLIANNLEAKHRLGRGIWFLPGVQSSLGALAGGSQHFGKSDLVGVLLSALV